MFKFWVYVLGLVIFVGCKHNPTSEIKNCGSKKEEVIKRLQRTTASLFRSYDAEIRLKVPKDYRRFFKFYDQEMSIHYIVTDSVYVGSACIDSVQKMSFECTEYDYELQWLLDNSTIWDSIQNVAGVKMFYRDHFKRKNALPCVDGVFMTGESATIVQNRWLHMTPCQNSINILEGVKQMIRLPGDMNFAIDSSDMNIYIGSDALASIVAFENAGIKLFESHYMSLVVNSEFFNKALSNKVLNEAAGDIAEKVMRGNNDPSFKYDYSEFVADVNDLLVKAREFDVSHDIEYVQDLINWNSQKIKDGALISYFNSDQQFFTQWVNLNFVMFYISLLFAIGCIIAPFRLTLVGIMYTSMYLFINGWIFSTKIPEYVLLIQVIPIVMLAGGLLGCSMIIFSIVDSSFGLIYQIQRVFGIDREKG